MSGHNDCVRPNGTWSNEMVPCSADYERLDVASDAAISGDNGGFYSPGAPIIVGGSGMSLGSNGFVIGGVTTRLGGRVSLSNSVFDWPRFSTTRSRMISVPLQAFADIGGNLIFSGSYIPIPSRYLHDGAQFGTLLVEYAFLQKPTALNLSPPFVSIVAYRNSGFVDATAPGPLDPTSGSVVWTSGRVYAAGAYVLPSTTATQNGFYFRCTTPGTANTPEPSWPTTIGATVTDGGGVTWVTQGRSGSLALNGATPDSIFNNGQVQGFNLDFDPNALGTTNVIDLTTHSYAVKVAHVITAPSNSLLPIQSSLYAIRLLSVSINYVLIDGMRFP